MSNDTGLSIRSCIFDRFADPLAAITAIGEIYYRSAANGVQTQRDGELMALVCMCEGKHIFEIGRTYHLIEGKLSMRSDAMLAEFVRRGGKFKWIATGDDGVAATLQLTRADGETITSSYSLSDAKEVGLIRSGSRWTKGPKAIGEMLRARCASRGVRMIDPGVNAGVYAPEELEDEVTVAAPAAAPATPTKPVKDDTPKTTKRETATETEIAATPDQPTPEPIDVPFVVSASASATTAVLMDIELLIGKAGLTKTTFEESLRRANPTFASLDALSYDDASQLLTKLRAKLGNS